MAVKFDIRKKMRGLIFPSYFNWPSVYASTLFNDYLSTEGFPVKYRDADLRILFLSN